MLSHEGSTYIHLQKKPRLHFGESLILTGHVFQPSTDATLHITLLLAVTEWLRFTCAYPAISSQGDCCDLSNKTRY